MFAFLKKISSKYSFRSNHFNSLDNGLSLVNVLRRLISQTRFFKLLGHALYAQLTQLQLKNQRIKCASHCCGWILVAAMGSACASHPPSVADCAQMDWFELGRRPGSLGQPLNVNEITRSCTADRLQTEDIKAGYDRGLNEFCQTSNAFELGLSDQNYGGVCPKELEPAFLKAYNQGRQVLELKVDNLIIDRQLDSLLDRDLASLNVRTGDAKALELPTEPDAQDRIKTLEKRREANLKRIYELESNIN